MYLVNIVMIFDFKHFGTLLRGKFSENNKAAKDLTDN